MGGTESARTFAFDFKNLKGAKGDTGDTVLDTNGKLLNSVLPEGYPYYEVVNDVVIVVTQTADGNGSSIIASATPVIGKTHTVMIDGVSHECVAWEHPDWGATIIGNGSYVDAEGMGEDVPFAFMFLDGDSKAYFFADGESTFSVRGFVKTIHQLDETFVPINLDGYRRFNIVSESPGDVYHDLEFYVNAIKEPTFFEPLYVNVEYGDLGFPKMFISPLVVYDGSLNLSTFTEQTFSTTLSESVAGKLLILDILDIDSKKRFFIDVGFAPNDDVYGYAETIEKVVPMNGINYLITITSPTFFGKNYTITIKKLSAVT